MMYNYKSELKRGKHIALIASVLISIIILCSIIANADCTRWVYYKDANKCINPHCGPGAVLYTKHEVGIKKRKCDKNGKIITESLPYDKIISGCCSK